MIEKTFTFASENNTPIFTYCWLPDNQKNIRAIIQISHGMAEYSARYKNFAKYLTDNNFAVYASDHRGHGKTAGNIKNLGYIGDNNKWQLIVEDMLRLTNIININHPNLPIFLLGHSLGSLFTIDYVRQYNNKIQGIILSAISGPPNQILLNLALLISKIEIALRNEKVKSYIMNQILFSNYGRSFRVDRTNFDWLTRTEAETLMDFWLDASKANGKKRTFYWQHPIDGETYVARFISEPPIHQTYNTPNYEGINTVRLFISAVKA